MQRTYESPVGVLTVVATARGVRAVLWPEEHRSVQLGDEASDQSTAAAAVADAAVQQLHEYFAGTRQSFDLPLDPIGTEFQQSVWMQLRSIPYGTTISYAEQAGRLGDSRKARAVGAANGKNPISIIVPCHRVVATNGALTGFAGGLDTKGWLLRHEAASN